MNILSQCEATSGVRSFIDQIFSHNLIMLIGADCSIATEPIAELSPNWNLVQVSLLTAEVMLFIVAS